MVLNIVNNNNCRIGTDLGSRFRPKFAVGVRGMEYNTTIDVDVVLIGLLEMIIYGTGWQNPCNQ